MKRSSRSSDREIEAGRRYTHTATANIRTPVIETVVKDVREKKSRAIVNLRARGVYSRNASFVLRHSKMQQMAERGDRKSVV